MDDANSMPQSTRPYIEKRIEHDGSVSYCVHGRGMMFCHRERWQADVKLHYMQWSISSPSGL